jgi:predicted transcriptional regulator
MAKSLKFDGKTETLMVNVLKSVKTAQDVLTHFESSLEQGGFAKGVPPYQKMCDTLLGQRLWSTPHQNEELEVEFQKLSSKAARIFETLLPYTEIMKKLSAVSSIEKATMEMDDSDEVIFKIISESRGPISFTALKTKAKLPKKELLKKLDNFEKSGLITSKISSGRKIYFDGTVSGR